jgi:choline dehydrogenase-like flavoprotein
MASLYGVPDGSSLADWPISYDDLEPWYTRAETELGVAGDETPYAERSAPYPAEPFERDPVGDWLADGATRRGWTTFTPPLAVNTRPRDGRAACVRCNECVGFTCPVDAKNGSHNTFIPRAVATGLLTMRTHAQATRVMTDASGCVTGVDYVANGKQQSASAGVVIVAGGAIETARLLLLSTSRHHPRGIGDHGGHLGRHLQSHTYPIALGILPRSVTNPNRGPGVSVATTALNHGNPGVIGGAMMADDFVKTPVTHWRIGLPPDVRRWGIANKRAMQELYLRTVDVRAPVQEIPTPDNRVTLRHSARDRLGLPVAELAGVVHPETQETAAFIRSRLIDWLEASGADRAWSLPDIPRGLSDWFHQAGTCRMSSDPSDGVVDPSGRVHGHDNLFIADGSVHVTNGGFNPALTILALALRTAGNVAAELA